MPGGICTVETDGSAFVTGFLVPPAYPHEIELQDLVAVLECTSREMIPKRFQNLDRQKVISDIKQLKVLLGERDSV
mgnify:CR=1 FL=1